MSKIQETMPIHSRVKPSYSAVRNEVKDGNKIVSLLLFFTPI